MIQTDDVCVLVKTIVGVPRFADEFFTRVKIRRDNFFFFIRKRWADNTLDDAVVKRAFARLEKRLARVGVDCRFDYGAAVSDEARAVKIMKRLFV